MSKQEELWDWVAKQMKIDVVPVPIQEEAEAAYLVDDILNPDMAETRQELLWFARERMRFFKRMRGWEQGHYSAEQGVGAQAGNETYVAELGDNEARRSEAVEEYIAKIAACEHSVYMFRKRFLGGGVLSPTQARVLVSSPAAVYLPLHYFISSGRIQVPVVDHEVDSHVVRPEESDEHGPYVPVVVVVHPPGKELAAKIRRMEWLLFPDEDGYPQDISVAQSSVLDELRKVSSRLPRSYPWREHQAAWFVLTGEPPPVPAVEGRCRASSSSAATYGTVTLTIQPWVPADTVRKFYGNLQKRILAGKPRSISERNLAVFRFIVEQREVQVSANAGRSPKARLVLPLSWRALLERWNQKYPKGHEWHYKDVQNFHRDYRRAEEAVVNPRYRTQTEP